MKNEAAKERKKTFGLSKTQVLLLRAVQKMDLSDPLTPPPSDALSNSADSYVSFVNRVLQSALKDLPVKIQLELGMLTNAGLLSKDTFKHIVLTVAHAILPMRFAKVSTDKLLSIAPWNLRLKDLAQDRGCLTLKRALRKGLVHELVTRTTFETECYAWAMSVNFGFGDLYNGTQTLPGYKDACESVHAAIVRSQKTRNGKGYSRGVWVKKLAPAMLTYWLPLGLWAMSIEDALETLRMFSAPTLLKRLQPSQIKEIEGLLLPDWESIDLQKIKPKMRDWRGRFSTAASDQELFRAETPMIALKYNGQSFEGREDYDNWTFESMPGFNFNGRW